MSVGPLAVEIFCVFCLAVYLLHKYADWKRQHFLVTLAALVAWYFSFIIIFILPLDISSTFYKQCLKDNAPTVAPSFTTSSTVIPVINFTQNASEEFDTVSPSTAHTATVVVRNVKVEEPCLEPWSHVPDHMLPDLWHVVYWTSMVLTWLIIPMMMSYSAAGDFTVPGKLKTALIENAIWYGSYLFVFGVLLIYVAVKPELTLDKTGLKVILVTASNTWGLFLVVLMLGFGLVEVPRTLWYNSKRGFMLSRTQFKLAKLSVEKSEAEEALEDVLEDVKRAAESIRDHHPLRPYIDTILTKCPEWWDGIGIIGSATKVCPENMRRSVQKVENAPNDGTIRPIETPTEKSLARLNKKVITAVRNHHRTQVQWSILVDQAIGLEDMEKNEGNSEHMFKHTFMPERNAFMRAVYTPSIEWYWKCLVKPWVLRVLAVALALFSAVVVWSEVTFFNKDPVLSLFAQFIHLAARHYNYFQIEVISCLTIAFLSTCTYYTVFKVRVLNYYYLAPFHQTDEYSLLFSGMFLCRLTPPLCLNFLGLIHLDSHVTKDHELVETSYTQIMGHMDVISIVSDGFNIYFPMAIVLLCAATYFHLGSRCLHFLGFDQFIGDDDITQEIVDEGRELVKREKRKRQRAEDSASRRREWQDRFGQTRSDSQRSGNRLADSAIPPGTVAVGITPSSSSENDHTQLLKDVAPIDYTGQNAEIYDDFNRPRPSASTSSVNADPLSASYQTHRGQTTPTSSGRPVRGIFDDI
ncbi:PREDICTED: LMBR1 domain-containing protein 2-like [Priapulus caudatus]|uniref:LMBR1 domain-containing protein 2-like n=1 Tax=Priapulus caudatus TaxID=37621 RepID=A0ABM1ESJ3_PRICU|nr:PREDICTED: LMBR1 domain-containing protein 2-like [Priapulus caudatus]